MPYVLLVALCCCDLNIHVLDVSNDTGQNVLTKPMSPTYNTSITKEFRLLDPVLHDLAGDPTETWFQHHSKCIHSQTLQPVILKVLPCLNSKLPCFTFFFL